MFRPISSVTIVQIERTTTKKTCILKSPPLYGKISHLRCVILSGVLLKPIRIFPLGQNALSVDGNLIISSPLLLILIS